MAGRVEHAHEDHDAVEYRLYPEIPEGYGERECEIYLEDQVDLYLAHLSRVLVDYVWQNEAFHLSVVPKNTAGAGPPHLEGRTKYGDNVEDEWFIFYLLTQLTKTFPQLVIKVWDNDGEFLLIEAANDLPKWLNPDTSKNRVFLYSGQVHIIPWPKSPAELTALPSGVPQLHQAIQCVRTHFNHTIASHAIQENVRRRITGYPERMYESIHHAHCYVPAPLAAVLDKCPQLVAPMVQAFYLRDPIDLKACITMKYFRPGTRVVRQVKFTKCLYAQLMQQRFSADKRGGWNIPTTNNPKFKVFDLGMKLAYGAEILCSRCGSDPTESINRTSKSDARWQHFVNTLSSKGYFRGELEGSQLYTKLYEDAKSFFCSSVITDPESSPDGGQQILRVLRSVTYDIEEMRKEEKDLPSPDDDSWLDMSQEQLDDMLNKASNFVPKSDSFDLSEMTESFTSFVDKVSSHEGAEFPRNSEESDIQFDPNSFIQTMQKMFEFDDSASNSSTDMSEYGSDGSDDELGTPSPPQVPLQPVPPPRSKKSSKLEKKTPSPLSPSGEDLLGMREYMEQMDRELSKTTIAQSFELQPAAEKKPRPARPPPPRPAAPQRRPNTAPPPPPKKKTAPRATLDDDLDIDDEDEDDDDFRPVDVNLTMVKNLLDSYSAQEGLAGPTSNLLGSMGITIPKNEDK